MMGVNPIFENCECNCIEGIESTLNNHRGEFVAIFQKNGNVVFGRINNIDNHVVEVIGPAGSTGFIFFNPGCPLVWNISEVYISICQITQVAFFSGLPYPNPYCDSPVDTNIIEKIQNSLENHNLE